MSRMLLVIVVVLLTGCRATTNISMQYQFGPNTADCVKVEVEAKR